jgi:FKBP-type peptidyl-prolyl cis-trans isomerase
MHGKLSIMKNISSWVLSLFALFCLVGGSLTLAQFDLKKLSDEEKARLFEERVAPDDVGAIPEKATTTESGLGYRVLVSGEGSSHPAPNDLVTISYKAWTEHGVRVDLHSEKPKRFQVNMGAPGIAEVLPKMVVGDRFRVWIKPELGIYSGKTPKWMRVYDLDLLAIGSAPPVPSNLAQPPDDVITTESGLKYVILSEGRGSLHPGPEDTVTIDYNRWSPEGVLLGSSIRRRKPESADLDGVVDGFAEAILGMTAGEKRRVWLPQELSDDYQEGTVIYDIELHSFISPPHELAEEFRMASEGATVTDSGLKYEVLWPGNHDRHPKLGDNIVINFAVWDTSGKDLDTSFKRGKPVGMTMSEEMPAGWREVLELMVEGERRRAWLPQALGFQGPEDAPIGDQIFEIDLLKIE